VVDWPLCVCYSLSMVSVLVDSSLAGDLPPRSLQDLVRSHSRRSVALCGRAARSIPTVEFYDDHEDVKGVQRCGSPWSCPSCSARLRGRRSLGIVAIATDVSANGGSLAMATLTLRHNAGMPLVDLLSAISAGWAAVSRDRSFKAFRDRAGIIGFVRGVEVTHGVNGWHPHLHVLFFSDRQLAPRDLQELSGILESGWFRGAFKVLGVSPASGVGVDVRAMSSDAAGYIAKVGFEVSGLGKGNSAFDLLLDGRVDKWKEYDRAMKGVRSLSISRELGRRYADEWGAGDIDIINDDSSDEFPNFSVGVNPLVWFVISGQSRLYGEFVRAARAGEVELYRWYASLVRADRLPLVDYPFYFRKWVA